MPVQARARETRESLLLVAAEVFAQSGFRSASLRDITRIAGVTQGALYFHFKSKADLASAIIERQHAASIAAVELVLNPEWGGLEGIVRLSAELAEQIATNPVVRAGLRLSTDSVDELASVSSRPYEEWISATRVLLERASERGELIADVDLDAAAEMIVSAFSGLQFLSVAVSGGGGLSARLERMWPTLLRGLAKDPKHPVIVATATIMQSAAK